MASNKEIVEAQRFNRRRLVTAFSSGTPGGRELEPRSHTGALLVGVGITVLFVIIAAILGRFAPKLPEGWENGTLVIEKASGARYLTIDGTLHPVANIASARLLNSAESLNIVELPSSALDGIPRGVQVGIPGAPDSLPSASALQEFAWSSCATGEGLTHTQIGIAQPLNAAESAVVTNDGKTYVIAGGRRYLLDSGESNVGVLLALSLDAADRHPVQANWLDLFPMGSDLRPIRLSNLGAPVNDMPARLQTAVVGSIIIVESDTDVRRYLVVGDGQVTQLTDTAYRLAQAGLGQAAANPLTASVSEITELETVQIPEVPVDWPDQFGTAVQQSERVCATLGITDSEPVVSLASMSAPSPEEVATAPTEQPGLIVTGGGGALVRASAGGNIGPVILITDMGKAFGLTGDTADTLRRFGYTGEQVTTVPSSWLSLVESGPDLSREAAIAAGGQR